MKAGIVVAFALGIGAGYLLRRTFGVGRLTGTCTYDNNGYVPAPGAIVTVAGKSAGTDTSGVYLIEGIPEGIYVVTFNFSVGLSAYPTDYADTAIRAGQTTVIDNQFDFEAIPF